MTDETVIEIRNAEVFLGGKTVLHDFNWQVKAGEHWFILGANGAGKTTLVKVLMGYAWPVFGAEVRVLGARYGAVNLSELRRNIAWVSPFMQRWTSGGWNALQLVISGLDGTLGLFRDYRPGERDKALEIMDRLGCAQLAEQHIDAMSSGEQVKILICRALMHNPELMLLDEACVHLDLKSRELLLETIDALARRENTPTIIFITQRIDDLLPVFSRGMILKAGRIVVQGAREAILSEENLFRAYDMPVKLKTNSAGRIWPVLE
ncbi:MAG: ATP-binding cassette domain-containing protein [Victivallaceae bacterium]|nr:ATP-binding cassette domain-containing protein [Victivallaceae bacterium]